MWKKQEERSHEIKQIVQLISEGKQEQLQVPQEVEDEGEVETLVEALGPNGGMVVIFLYSKTCGVCRSARLKFQELAVEARGDQILFLSHNVFDEYDQRTDLSLHHQVKSVPCFLFLDDGAVVERLNLRDLRAMGDIHDSGRIRMALNEDAMRLHQTFRQVLFNRAPATQ